MIYAKRSQSNWDLFTGSGNSILLLGRLCAPVVAEKPIFKS